MRYQNDDICRASDGTNSTVFPRPVASETDATCVMISS
jgi:hypothetical protein